MNCLIDMVPNGQFCLTIIYIRKAHLNFSKLQLSYIERFVSYTIFIIVNLYKGKYTKRQNLRKFKSKHCPEPLYFIFFLLFIYLLIYLFF